MEETYLDRINAFFANYRTLKTNRDIIIEEIRNNPNVTNKQLSIIIGISETAIENNIRILRENKIIERIGSKKTGFWKII